jgi:hypothetical protein
MEQARTSPELAAAQARKLARGAPEPGERRMLGGETDAVLAR